MTIVAGQSIMSRRLFTISSCSQHLALPNMKRHAYLVLTSKSLMRRLIGSEFSLPNATLTPLRKFSNDSSKDKKENSRKHQQDQQSNEVPRRIVVKSRGEDEKIDLSRIRERVGTFIPKKSRVFPKSNMLKRARLQQSKPMLPSNSPSHHQSTPVAVNSEVKDAAGQPILIPGTPLFRSRGDHSSSGRTEPTPRKRIRLPIVNASALLDKQHYCIQSANASTSRSGTEAARRLYRGKQELVSVLRREILSQEVTSATSPSSIGIPPFYVLQGHGVPPQLLQAHIDLADSILKLCQAHECSFSNSALKVDWLRTRRQSDNSTHVMAWTTTAAQFHGEDLTSNMELYLTVMDRIARALGLVLPPSKSSSQHPSHNTLRTTAVDEYDNEWSSSPTPTADLSWTNNHGGSVLKHWNAEFLRGQAVSSDWLPPSDVPIPLVEWTPLTGMAAPGRVTIRLQGYPSRAVPFATETSTTFSSDGNTTTTRTKPLRRKKAQALSLVFDACFRN